MTITNGYASRAELKTLIGATQTANDADIDRAIEAASRQIDRMTARRFYLDASASTRTYRASEPDVLWVEDFDPATTPTIVTDESLNGTFNITWEAADYQLEPLNAAADGLPVTKIVAIDDRAFPVATRAAVRVTARWGWPAVPTDIEQACLLLASRLFKRKDAPFGIVGSLDVGQLRIAAKDPDVITLVAPYRRFMIVAVAR